MVGRRHVGEPRGIQQDVSEGMSYSCSRHGLKGDSKEDRSLKEGDREVHGLKLGCSSIQGGRENRKSLVLKVFQHDTVKFCDM